MTSNTNLLLRIFASLIEVSVICLLVYHTYLSPIPTTRAPVRQGEVYKQTRVPHDVGDKIKNRPNTERRSVSRSEYIVMKNCPPGWPVEILKPPTVGRTPAQVCRNANGDRHWVCDPAWVRLKADPFCIPGPGVDQNVTGNSSRIPQAMDPPEDLSQLSEVLRISTRQKLLYVHIPYTEGSGIDSPFLFSDSEAAADNISSLIKNITITPEVLRNYHKFTMVRHPCSRLISAWEQLGHAYDNVNGSDADKTWTAENLDSSAVSSFDSFVRHALSPGGSIDINKELRLKPQVEVIASSGFGRFQKVLMYERWNESMAELSKSMQRNVSIRPPWDNTSGSKKCNRLYTQSSWTKLLSLYGMDFCVFGYSRAINEDDIVPPFIADGSIATRIQQCKKITRELKKLSNKECVIHTYFQLPPNASEEQRKSSEAMIGIWKFAWMSAGWKPRVLTSEDARNHTQHDVILDKFKDLLPATNLTEYEMSSFMRHIAMSTVGGGWLSDYDVIPLRMPMCLSPLNEGFLTVYQLFVPSLISGNGSEFLRLAELMMDSKWKDKLVNSNQDSKRVSDMQVFSHLVKEGAIIGMRTVVEARHLFEEAFDCDKSWTTPADYRYFTQTPSTLTPLPWVVHFSHASVTYWISTNRTELWPGSSWNARSLVQREDIRADLMRDALQFLNGVCSYNKNFH